MRLPNLQKIVSFIQEKLNLKHWAITTRWVDDLRDQAGNPIAGLCQREEEVPRALLSVRTPRTDTPEELRELLDTAIHEVTHCRLAELAAEGTIGAEERATYPIAGWLTELLEMTPLYAELLAKQLPKTLLAAQSRARAGGNTTMMDPEKIKAALAALKEGNGEAALALLEELLVAAATGEQAAPGEGEPMPPKEDDKPTTTPEQPPMGMNKDEKPSKLMVYRQQVVEPLMKQLQDQMTEDRAAAVDGLLDTRPDLKPAQREHGRTLGIEKGVASLRKYLAEVVPAAPAKTEAMQEPKVKLGLEKLPRAGRGAGFRPSGNRDSMRRLRISADPETAISAPGCVMHDAAEIAETGKLMTMSIWDALPEIQKTVSANVALRKAKMGGAA